MPNFWQRLGNMFLDALQVLFSTAWGILWAAISGGIPALAGVGFNEAKYGSSYWQDMIPIFIAGALVGVSGFVQSQKNLQKDPPKLNS